MNVSALWTAVITFPLLDSPLCLVCIASGAACTVLLVYMFWTDCWLIAAMYTAWLIVDWNTPKRGDQKRHSTFSFFTVPF